jgi:aminopeptidase N
VTCRDWFQLTLKEGLTVFRDQEFSGDMGSNAVKRIEGVASLRGRQFAEDAGPMSVSVVITYRTIAPLSVHPSDIFLLFTILLDLATAPNSSRVLHFYG